MVSRDPCCDDPVCRFSPRYFFHHQNISLFSFKFRIRKLLTIQKNACLRIGRRMIIYELSRIWKAWNEVRSCTVARRSDERLTDRWVTCWTILEEDKVGMEA